MRNIYPKFSLAWIFVVILSISSFGTGSDKPLSKDKETDKPLRPDRPRKVETLPNAPKAKRKALSMMSVAPVSPITQGEEEVRPFTESIEPLKSKGIKPIPTKNNDKALAPDPFMFTITTDKDSVNLNEEFEVSVKVNWVDYGVNNGVRFLPEWYKYTLKVVMPKGFIQTGGDYTDYCTKPVDANNQEATFTIKGKFEYKPEEAKFTVLRGFEGAGDLSSFIWKGEKVINFISVMERKYRTAKNLSCNDTGVNLNYRSTVYYWRFDPTTAIGVSLTQNPYISGTNYVFRLKIQNKTCNYKISLESANNTNPVIYYNNGVGWRLSRTLSTEHFAIPITQEVLPDSESSEYTLNIPVSSIGSNCEINIGMVFIPQRKDSNGNYQPFPGAGNGVDNTSRRCGLSFTSVSIPNNSPTTPTNLSSTKSGSSWNLSGTCATGTLKWYSNSDGTGSITPPASPTVTTTYHARCETTSCNSSLSSHTITINDPCSSLTTPTIQGSSSGCNQITLTSSIDADSYQWWIDDGRVGTSKSYDATTSATYVLVVKKAGCPDRISPARTITVNPIPSAPTTTGATTLPPNAQATLTAGNCSGTITWDNTTQTGSPITVTVTSTTTFKAKCTVNTCTSGWSSGETVTVFGSVAVKEDSKSNTSNCASSDGSVTVSASGGSNTGFTFRIDGGLYQASGTFNNLSAGSHVVRAKDSNGQESSDLTITISSPDAPAQPVLTEYSKNINDGQSYTLLFPANACPAGGSPDWITNFTNPISTAGEYKAVCKDGSCLSRETIFTLSVDNRSTSISSTNPNCFNTGGSVTANNSGAGDCFYSLYNVGTSGFVAGQIDKYAGGSYTFTGISEGTYRVYIRPVSGTEVVTNDITLIKNCSGGYIITNVVLANCFGSGGTLKVTVTNPQVSGYLYTLIDAGTNEIKRNEVGGASYTFTNVRKGEYRVDITENVIGGGVIWGNERVNLTNNACTNSGITLALVSKANCTGNYGSFSVSVDNPTAGIGYIYTLFNTNGNVQIGQPRASGASCTFNNLQAGTYRVDIVEDQLNGGVIIGNNTITIESDCSDLLVDLSADATLNCTNNGGVNLKIKSTQKVNRPNAWYRYTLYERYWSNLGTQGYRPVARTLSTINYITSTTTFPLEGPDSSWTLTDKNTWIVKKIQKTNGSAYTPIEAGDYQVDVEYIYYDGSTQINSAGRSTVLPLSNNLNAVPEITGSVCGRNDGKIKLNLTCGIGKYAIALYRNDNEQYAQVAGGFPNRITATNHTFNNLAPGRYYAIVKEVGFDNVTERRNIQIDDIIVPQLNIPITITPAESAAFCPGSTVTLGISNAPVGSTYLWTGVPAGQQTLAAPVITLPTTPGDYQFITRLTLGACNSGNVVRELTVRTPPTIIMDSNSPDDGIGSIETGDNLEVTVTPVAGRTYEWKYSVGTDAGQWTGTIIDPTIAPYNTSVTPYDKIINKNIQVSDNGFYKVKVTDQYGCVNYNKTKVLIQPFLCKITATGTTRCYIETNKRWADLTVTIKNRKLNWKGDIVVKRIKDLEGNAVSDNAIINYNWFTTGATTKIEELPKNAKIPDGIYEVKLREKRSDEESGPGFQCEATEYITVGCQRKCKKLKPCVTGDCCGIPAQIDLNDEIKLETIAINDVLRVNDFDMIVTKIIAAPTPPTYQCNIEGITKVPVFDNVFIGLKTDITKTPLTVFNECKELVGGEIITLYKPDNWDKPIQGKAIAKAIYESAKEVFAILTGDSTYVGMSPASLANVAQQMREQAEKDLPKELATKTLEALREMEEANKEYEKARDAGNQAGKDAAEAKFIAAQNKLKAAEAETLKYLDLYQRIVQLTLVKMWTAFGSVPEATSPINNDSGEAQPLDDFVPINQITALTAAEKDAIVNNFKTEAESNLKLTFKYFIKLHKGNNTAIKDLEQKVKVYEKTEDNTTSPPITSFSVVSPALKLSDYIYATMCKTCTPTTDPKEQAMVNTTEKALTKRIKELFNKLVYTQD
jgi:hypothetical protein